MNLPEIDRLVATKVMGWKMFEIKLTDSRVIGGFYDDGKIFIGVGEWSPTSDIRVAWQVVKKFYEKGDKVTVTNTLGGNWCCYVSTGTSQFSAIAETAPLAICLAALKACGIEVETE